MNLPDSLQRMIGNAAPAGEKDTPHKQAHDCLQPAMPVGVILVRWARCQNNAHENQ